MLSVEAWLKTREGQRAMDALREGDNHKTVASRFCVTQKFLSDARRRAKLVPAKLLPAIADYRAGMSMRDINLIHGVSSQHLYRYAAPERRNRRNQPRWCAWCGDDMPTGKDARQKTCSRACSAALREDERERSRVTSDCPGCGVKFTRPSGREIAGGYCTPDCRSDALADDLRRDLNRCERYFLIGWTIAEVAYELDIKPNRAKRIRWLLERQGRLLPSTKSRRAPEAAHATS